MRKMLLLSVAVLATSPAFAQHHGKGSNTSAVGVGTGVANSSSQSGAVAISGQGGAGGNSNSSLVINNPANTTSTLNQNVSGSTQQRIESVVSGTTTVRNAPGIVAPGLSAAGLETCLGSASGGISVVGFGLTGGSSTPDPNCNARLDARTLWSIGLKAAAVARLCLSEPIYRSMPDVCDRYMPVVQPAGYSGSYVAPAPVTALMSADAGPIEVVEGRTGRTRMCDTYDAIKQKCLAWTGAPPKIKMVSSAPKPKKSVEAARAPTVNPAPAPAAAETKKEN